ncbi:hypothetical protein SAMN05421810_101104 [Amycolatopsis arida]|uniref:Uncharacterized protein n=2 Tax=Amycolatopsis arida TaxID=587909 RepID=A0A1I5KDQ1_9PSEU|nr:hypothetical protein SAMN05421810_101104 [Amycolatopsis arida]
MLCAACLGELVAALRALLTDGAGGPGLLAELNTTLSRQHTTSPGPGVVGQAAARPMPYHEAASETSWVLANTITTWAREVHACNPHLLPPAGSTAAAAAWLVGLPGLLALHPAADELHDEITHVVARVRRVIDRPPDRIYAGPCDAPIEGERCPDHLYAHPGANRVQCGTCGTEHDVTERRNWMIDYAAGLRVTATVALGWARLLLDKTIPRGTWDSWVSRGRIVPHGTDGRGRPVYRFGTVRDLALAHVSKPRHTR